MPFAPKLVLHCPNGIPAAMEELAQQFVADGVKMVAIVGPSCREIEDTVDNAAVAAGSPERHFILTSSHPNDSLAEVIEFAEGFVGDYEGPVQVVKIAR
ncbi:DUF7684 family protein [Roseateles sp.]|uniref:DUF7684 family protein n=1 Tax=Roseateles sp. TaxID=1971397 RepID=UPI003BADAEE1